MEIKKTGICGCGLMGSGVAEAVAKAGLEVIVAIGNGEYIFYSLQPARPFHGLL